MPLQNINAITVRVTYRSHPLCTQSVPELPILAAGYWRNRLSRPGRSTKAQATGPHLCCWWSRQWQSISPRSWRFGQMAEYPLPVHWACRPLSGSRCLGSLRGHLVNSETTPDEPNLTRLLCWFWLRRNWSWKPSGKVLRICGFIQRKLHPGSVTEQHGSIPDSVNIGWQPGIQNNLTDELQQSVPIAWILFIDGAACVDCKYDVCRLETCWKEQVADVNWTRKQVAGKFKICMPVLL